MSSSTIWFGNQQCCMHLQNLQTHGLCACAQWRPTHRIKRGQFLYFVILSAYAVHALFQQQHSISLSDGAAVALRTNQMTMMWAVESVAQIVWPHSLTILSAQKRLWTYSHMYIIHISLSDMRCAKMAMIGNDSNSTAATGRKRNLFDFVPLLTAVVCNALIHTLTHSHMSAHKTHTHTHFILYLSFGKSISNIETIAWVNRNGRNS